MSAVSPAATLPFTARAEYRRLRGIQRVRGHRHGHGEVRERDLARLRDVVAALHAPPGEATPNPEGPWGTAHDLLGITEGAVRTHLENACAALGVTNRLAAGAAAFDAAPPRGPAQRRETGP